MDDVVRARPLGLETAIDADSAGFSGGELRRIGLARAYLCDPQVLILDEPFAGLEAALADRLTANLSQWATAARAQSSCCDMKSTGVMARSPAVTQLL